MAKPTEIAACKERFSSHSDEQLIAEKHQWVEHCAEHIAAVQLLHERQSAAQLAALKESRRQHAEALKQNMTLHGKTQLVAWLAFVAAVVGILVPLLTSNSSSISSQQSKQLAPQAPTASPSLSSNSAPQVTKTQSAKQPATPKKP